MNAEKYKNTTILGKHYPIIGMSPMDGVSDPAFRQITKKYGNPDILFTEFSNVMGICLAPDKVLGRFHYTEAERPIAAQLFGVEADYFYHAAKIVAALGFDGVDINMGCPAPSVSGRGAGAGLIRTPDLAREIIYQVQRGVNDWVVDGKLTGLKAKHEKYIKELITNYKLRIASDTEGARVLLSPGQVNLTPDIRHLIPVSVKTRIGYDEPVTESWIKNLTLAKPEWISVHGRTLKQLYRGLADRTELKKAVEATNLPVLVNGDINSRKEALEVIEQTGAIGALIGRGAFGNPWAFTPLLEERVVPLAPGEVIRVMLEHAKLFDDLNNHNERAFVQMRKHLGWYTKTISNLEFLISNEKENDSDLLQQKYKSIKDLRIKLMQVRNLKELEEILKTS